MKKPNLQITDTDKRDESEVNGIDQIINKITEEKLSQTKERHTHTNTGSTQNTKETRPEKKFPMEYPS